MNEPSIDLRSLVVAIRKSLEETDLEMRQAQKAALFELESIELELKFLVEERDGLKGGFDLKILSAGATEDIKTEQVQTVKVKYLVSKTATVHGVVGSRAHGKGADESSAVDIEPL